MAIISDSYKAAQRLTQTDAENEAEGIGAITWMPHTMTDPGCFDRDVDIQIKNWRYDVGEGVWTASVTAWVGAEKIFDREYVFYYSGAYMQRDYEDV